MVPGDYLKAAGDSARRGGNVDDAAVVGADRARALEERSLEASRAAERPDDAAEQLIAAAFPGDDAAAGAVFDVYHIGHGVVFVCHDDERVLSFRQVGGGERRFAHVRPAHEDGGADGRGPGSEEAFARLRGDDDGGSGAGGGGDRLLRDDAHRAPLVFLNGDEHVYRVHRRGADRSRRAPRARRVARPARLSRQGLHCTHLACASVRGRHRYRRALFHRYLYLEEFFLRGFRPQRNGGQRGAEQRRGDYLFILHYAHLA
ncbi:hypothetical protein SDC9_130007 [bioreactor metagenome]|uniref:Uncharacterized protein n=1 Tax=bioreactor metagenome TaxID=1076179 RepID=A0A645D1D8_9ZZZZ